VKNFKKNSKFYFSIKVLAISDNSDFSKKKIIFFLGGGVPQFFFGHFSSTFTLISAHTNFHDPRSTPCGRKVRAEREERGGERKNNGVNRGHYVLHQRWRTPTAGARTSLGPIGQFIQKFKMQGTPCPIFLLNS
jgi:hypothetical protein